MNFFSYLIENHTDIIGAAFAIHAAAVVIVNLTPTPSDDKVVGKLYKVIEVFAGILTKIAKK
jgi:hypothetical protein